MRSIVRAPEMRHAVNARIRSALASATVRIEFLLRQYVAASLENWDSILAAVLIPNRVESAKDYLARKGHHLCA